MKRVMCCLIHLRLFNVVDDGDVKLMNDYDI